MNRLLARLKEIGLVVNSEYEEKYSTSKIAWLTIIEIPDENNPGKNNEYYGMDNTEFGSILQSLMWIPDKYKKLL